jgi:succinyl-CoA synthetase alpha subunit
VAFVDVDPRKIGHEMLGVPVVAVEDAPQFAEAVALGAVSGPEARRQIREAVAGQGRHEGVDFVSVA